jgi:peptide/nickel transport system substrate-binding protein
MQAANAQVMAEMWREVGLNIRMQVQENWGQVMDPSTPRGVDDNSHTAHFADPVSAIPVLIGPNGGLTRRGYWSNAEALGLVETLEGSTDRARRRAAFTRLLEILEWEDPAISTLHRTANFTAKRREIAWKPSGSFVMDLGPGNVSFRRV